MGRRRVYVAGAGVAFALGALAALTLPGGSAGRAAADPTAAGSTAPVRGALDTSAGEAAIESALAASAPAAGTTAATAPPESPSGAPSDAARAFRNGDGTVLALASDPRFDSTVYAGTLEHGVFRSADGGQNWLVASTGILAQRVDAITVDPHGVGTVYAGTGDGVYRSDDSAGRWTRASRGLFADETRAQIDRRLTRGFVYALAFDPAREGVGYAATARGVFGTVDGGQSWRRLHPGFTAALALSPGATPTLYVADSGGGVVKSTDGGRHWRPAGLAGRGVTALAASPRRAGLVYAATEGAEGQGRMFASTDAGETWHPAEQGLPPRAATWLYIDPYRQASIYASAGGDLYLTRNGPWRRIAQPGDGATYPGGKLNGVR